jgi:uncharacterized protein (DUF58 family)
VRSELWLYVMGGVLAASLLLRQPQLFAIATILLLVASVSWVWERFCLRGLRYSRTLAQTRAFFGEEVRLTVEVVNDKLLPLAWVEVDDTVPGAAMTFAPAHAGPSHIPGRRMLTMLMSVRWYERVRRHYRLTCGARGIHTFGPAILRTGDVFGLAAKEMEVLGEDYLLVYPRIVPLEQLRLPPGNPFGDAPAFRRWLFEDPLRTVGVREYRPGDSSRRVHWKATARAPEQALQVKLFEPTTAHRLLVLLNVSTAAQNWSWQGYDPEALEAAITCAASVCSWAVAHGYQLGLSANARLFHSSVPVRLPPSRDPRALMHALEALARLVPMATMACSDLVELEARGLAFGTTVVLISCVASAEVISALQRVRRRGHLPALLLISAGDAPELDVEGVAAYTIRVEDLQA